MGPVFRNLFRRSGKPAARDLPVARGGCIRGRDSDMTSKKTLYLANPYGFFLQQRAGRGWQAGPPERPVR